MCLYETVLDLFVLVSKFGIDTTKNRWYRVDLKKLVSLIPKFHSCRAFFKRLALEAFKYISNATKCNAKLYKHVLCTNKVFTLRIRT